MKKTLAALLALLFLAPAALAQGVVGAAAYLNAALSTTVSTVKGTAGTTQFINCYNPNAAVAFVQVFDVASATSVTLGTTTPKMSIGFPPSTAVTMPLGVAMLKGIKIAATTTPTGSTAPGAALSCTVGFN